MYARTLYKTRYRQTDGCTSTDKGIYMCVSVSSEGLLLLISQTKGVQKNEMQIKPIERMKIFWGRVAPPLWGCVFMGLPHLKIFFEIFFSMNVNVC